MGKKLFTSLLCPSTKVTEDQLESDVNLLNMEKTIFAMNRRNFLGALAAAGATAATVGAAGFATKAEAQTLAPTALNVLNFALQLEYFEANFYLAVTGQGLLSSTITGTTTLPMNPPAAIALDTQTMATAVGLAANEVAHVLLLQSAITAGGGTPVAMPVIDYGAGAGMVTITTQAQFLAAARQFEAVGASAYAGAADLLFGSPDLTTAAQILGTEAQHLGAINYLCYVQGLTITPFDPLDYPPGPTNGFFTVTPPSAAASLYGEQQILGGSPVIPTPTPLLATSPLAVTQPGPALGAIRSASEVLAVLFGVATPTITTSTSSSGAVSVNNPWPTGVKSGGYFPKGLNGGIVSS